MIGDRIMNSIEEYITKLKTSDNEETRFHSLLSIESLGSKAIYQAKNDITL